MNSQRIQVPFTLTLARVPSPLPRCICISSRVLLSCPPLVRLGEGERRGGALAGAAGGAGKRGGLRRRLLGKLEPSRVLEARSPPLAEGNVRERGQVGAFS